MCYKTKKCFDISRIQIGYYVHVEAFYYDEEANRIGFYKFSDSAPKAEVVKSLRNKYDCVVPATIANGEWKRYQVLSVDEVRALMSA